MRLLLLASLACLALFAAPPALARQSRPTSPGSDPWSYKTPEATYASGRVVVHYETSGYQAPPLSGTLKRMQLQ